MRNKLLSKEKRNNFHKEEELIIYLVEKGYYLEEQDIDHIFKNIVREDVSKKDEDKFLLIEAVKFLLNNLTGKARDLLIEIINSTFKVQVNYSRQRTRVDDYDSTERCCGYSVDCLDKSVSEIIIDVYRAMKSDKEHSISEQDVLKVFGLE